MTSFIKSEDFENLININLRRRKMLEIYEKLLVPLDRLFSFLLPQVAATLNLEISHILLCLSHAFLTSLKVSVIKPMVFCL